MGGKPSKGLGGKGSGHPLPSSIPFLFNQVFLCGSPIVPHIFLIRRKELKKRLWLEGKFSIKYHLTSILIQSLSHSGHDIQ